MKNIKEFVDLIQNELGEFAIQWEEGSSPDEELSTEEWFEQLMIFLEDGK
jgi:hypothetical protein